MNKKFYTIGLIGKPDHAGANRTLTQLHQWLLAQGHHVMIEKRVAHQLPVYNVESGNIMEIGERADLAIVVGGDGNMLSAARELCGHDIAVIGVNRGNLGFLTDLHPDNFETPLKAVLEGNFVTEHRFLLNVQVIRNGKNLESNTAMNEVVLHRGKIAHMLEFEVYIDDKFTFGLNADGMILSTPTGSTAYSLSGGGPILTPDLEAIALVPMYPHTLSTRPVVINGLSEVRVNIAPRNCSDMQINCDSHISINLLPSDEIVIRQHPQKLRMVHPQDYSYPSILRKKLGWGSRLL